jgi:hypothetical protein
LSNDVPDVAETVVLHQVLNTSAKPRFKMRESDVSMTSDHVRNRKLSTDAELNEMVVVLNDDQQSPQSLETNQTYQDVLLKADEIFEKSDEIFEDLEQVEFHANEWKTIKSRKKRGTNASTKLNVAKLK